MTWASSKQRFGSGMLSYLPSLIPMLFFYDRTSAKKKKKKKENLESSPENMFDLWRGSKNVFLKHAT